MTVLRQKRERKIAKSQHVYIFLLGYLTMTTITNATRDFPKTHSETHPPYEATFIKSRGLVHVRDMHLSNAASKTFFDKRKKRQKVMVHLHVHIYIEMTSAIVIIKEIPYDDRSLTKSSSQRIERPHQFERRDVETKTNMDTIFFRKIYNPMANSD